MVLIDSSAWIHWFRPNGDKTVAARVDAALQAGEAAWCAMVRLELWNGAAGAQEQKILRKFAALLPDLPVTDEVWNDACELARSARAKGLSVPATDLLIFACARHHGAVLDHADSDFDLLDSLRP